jgi:hypothetical protein
MAYTPMAGLLAVLSVAAPSPQGRPPQIDTGTTSTLSVDEYLFEKYLKTPKFDKKDFTSKDPKAAALLDMPLRSFVIGCMFKEFKMTVYAMFKALDMAGYHPGFTSGFRDDYRQQLITYGTRAKIGDSYHGGSNRGGCGHGTAIDIVSIDGSTRDEQFEKSEAIWRWIDRNGSKFKVFRPSKLHIKDPSHVQMIQGDHEQGRTRVAHAGKHKHRFSKHSKHHRHFAGHKNSARG